MAAVKAILRPFGKALDSFGRGLQASHAFIEILPKHQPVLSLGKNIPIVHSSSFVAPSASVIGNVDVGRTSSVWYSAVVRAEDGSKITIGEGTNVQEGAVISVDRDNTVIGNNVTISHGASLRNCKIGDNALIGVGAVLLPFVSVGKNSIVGAASVVDENTVIPDGQVWYGNPAKFQRKVTEADIVAATRATTAAAQQARVHAVENAKGAEELIADEEQADETEFDDPPPKHPRNNNAGW